MSVQVPCPTCRAILTIKPGAATIRCAGCNTTLAIESDAAPPPAALPLPFAKPKPPVAPARRTPVPSPAAQVPPKPAPAPVVKRMPIDRERQRQIREELEAMDEEERKEGRRLERLGELCKKARDGVMALAFGVQASAAAGLFSFLGIMAINLGVVGGVLFLWVAAVSTGLHFLLTGLGFGVCVAGPKPMRGVAVAGLVATAAHLVFAVLTVFVVFARALLVTLAGDPDALALQAVLSMANVLCNLASVSGLPLMLLLRVSPAAYLIPLVAAGLEFAKISLIGVLGNRYASAGKDPELGYHAMRFVYRIFGLVVVAAVVLPLIWVVNFFAAGGGFNSGMFIAIQMAMGAYFLWWLFAWSAQYRVLNDVREVILPERFLDKRERLDDEF